MERTVREVSRSAAALGLLGSLLIVGAGVMFLLVVDEYEAFNCLGVPDHRGAPSPPSYLCIGVPFPPFALSSLFLILPAGGMILIRNLKTVRTRRVYASNVSRLALASIALGWFFNLGQLTLGEGGATWVGASWLTVGGTPLSPGFSWLLESVLAVGVVFVLLAPRLDDWKEAIQDALEPEIPMDVLDRRATARGARMLAQYRFGDIEPGVSTSMSEKDSKTEIVLP